MARDRNPITTDEDGYESFEVIVEQSIGSVVINDDGADAPHVAAFKLIAQHDTEGTYRFPMPDGRWNVVTVEFHEQ